MKTKWNKYPPFSVAVQALSLAVLLMVVSCADKDLPDEGNSQEEQGMEMTFDVRDVQDAPEADMETGDPETRAGKAKSAYPIGKIDVEDGDSLCLIETTVDGVNPVKRDNNEVITRGTVKTAIDADFGLYAWRINANNWHFHNEQVRPNGTLYNTYRWKKNIGPVVFFAYYPYHNEGDIQTSPITPLALPYIDFTVNPNVHNQKDLMLSRADITYDNSGVAPAVPLYFGHALTAVKFAVGDNLSWNWTIYKVEIIGAYGKGRFSYDGTEWGGQNTPQTFTLDGVSLSTAKAVNSEITGPNHTFLMIPQQLTGRGVKAKIYFTNGKAITATLKGEWKAWTTKTYKLSNSSTSNWDWQLTASSPAVVPYNSNVTGAYGITSYRRATDGTVQPVPWKVESYYYDGSWKATPPAWLTGLTKSSGNGGTAAEQGVGTLTVDVVDRLALRIQKMKNSPAKGAPGAYYDLSTHDIKGNATQRNSANCYVISSPGYYQLPLAYGNAIKNDGANAVAYASHSSSGNHCLWHFRDHNDQAINNPWIAGKYQAAGAYVAWADETSLVRNLAITPDKLFLQFQVTQADIRQGNVVLAVTDASNNTLWSYHLWFAPDDVLDKIPVTNKQGVMNHFTKETLGWKYTQWTGTSYEATRSVGVAVRQLGGPRKVAMIWIHQAPALISAKGYAVLYQWGRKDAFPSAVVAEGTIVRRQGGVTFANQIKNPRVFYIQGNEGDWHPANEYDNLWSADDPAQDSPYNNTIVKTVYDPSPVGCKVPPRMAFTGFSKHGGNFNGRPDLFNVVDNSAARFNAIQGYEFYNAPSSPTATIYFPTTGYRGDDMGYGGGTTHFWVWTANANYRHSGTCLWGMRDALWPQSIVYRGFGIGIHPVAE